MQNLQVQRSKWRTLKEAKTETIKEKLKSWESSSAAGGLKVKDARFTFTDQRWSNATYMSRYRSLYYFISFILPSCISSNYIPYPIIVGSVCRGSPLNLPWSKAHVVPEEVKEGGLSVSLQLESCKLTEKHTANKNCENLNWLWTNGNCSAGKWSQSGLLHIQ